MPGYNTQRIAGWGGWPRAECAVFRPEKRRGILDVLCNGGQTTYIARGLGRSYGDVAVNPGGGVISTTRLNRMLSFDDACGVLECEAGVSLAEILDVFVPRGWFLPVTPGTKFVTVGGAIAHDVHGKNHHVDGSFGQHVLQFTLLTPTGMLLTCSPTENSEVFWATVGGAGLTGFILTAKIRLIHVTSAYIRVDYRRCENFDAVLAAIRETDARYKYSVAWVDCLAKGKSLGRSVLMSGDHIEANALPSSYGDALSIPGKFQPGVPFDFPGFVLNPLSIGLFNKVFYAKHRTKEGQVVDYNTYFYPLDAIHHWNRIYGKKGFTQYQATFPTNATEGLRSLLEKLSVSGRASFLAVLKRMGQPSQGMLSHPIDGWTLTLDLPIGRGIEGFLHECDAIVVKNGGRLYMAKDACTRADAFAAMYPRLKEFQAVKNRLDPDGKLSSRLARRCGIVEGAPEP
ncbi:MAG TPA: FAD-binding oxidoreductase [Candidatus Hydrogenedentes bacterium]|nr:FAD-binding oxidoreductase [Candidatus Hydrogenedentota bacterium]